MTCHRQMMPWAAAQYAAGGGAGELLGDITQAYLSEIGGHALLIAGRRTGDRAPGAGG